MRLGGVLVGVAVAGCAVSPSVSAPSGPTVTAAPVTVTAMPPPAPVTVTAPPVTVTVPEVGPSPSVVRQRDAVVALAALPVKGRASSAGYQRAMFGQAWTDDVDVRGGHNGCDTRNDVLRRDLRNVVLKPGSSGCAVLSGQLYDPYSAKVIAFKRGQGTSSMVQIDHVVALGNAWETGAQQMAPEMRRDMANDPLNLWAVSGAANQQKGAGDAATWLPANKAVRCRYVARQVSVKATYGLWVTEAERDAMNRVLSGCPGQPLPAANTWDIPAPAGG